jgi:hypothetical protein
VNRRPLKRAKLPPEKKIDLAASDPAATGELCLPKASILRHGKFDAQPDSRIPSGTIAPLHGKTQPLA